MNKLAPLLALYFSQGLPFGFQATALPLLLRERGASLSSIGFASLLATPWLAKALWAPLVDRYGSERFGRRKSWIVPMQLALAGAALLASRTDDLVALAAIVLAMNFFAATQDIAVDALAVSWLDRAELGPGNAIQVVGYKLGMLAGGGLLVWASAQIGWRGLFRGMALLMLVALMLSLTIRETSRAPEARSRVRFRDIAARLQTSIRQRQTLALMSVVLTYKMGEALADGMWKPMLLDRGFAASDIGLWSGTFGLTCSLLGSLGGGLVVRRTTLWAALFSLALVRTVGILGEWWISGDAGAGPTLVIVVTCLEHLGGGALTTVLFALMMRFTDRQIGATQYTLLASLEVLGKMPPSMLSGVVAEALGYPALFAIASVLSIMFVLLVRALRRPLADA